MAANHDNRKPLNALFPAARVANLAGLAKTLQAQTA